MRHSETYLLAVVPPSMANLMRSAKSANHWSEYELLAFNIKVVTVDTVEFFGIPELPPPPVSETILNNLRLPNPPVDKEDLRFFNSLADTELISSSCPLVVNDFAASLLFRLNYDDPDRRIRTSTEIPLWMDGKRFISTVGICVMERLDWNYFLVVEEDKRPWCRGKPDPEPRLIAQAIGAFQRSNLLREESGRPSISSKLMAGIIMVGTAPIFYKIPITTALVDSVMDASFPAEETVVMKYIPSGADVENFLTDGMRPLANRRVAFQCLEAFKAALI